MVGTTQTSIVRRAAQAAVVFLLAVVVGWCLFAIAQPLLATENAKATRQLLTNASALNTAGNVGAADMPQCRETATYLSWSTGTASGAVTMESSYDSAYTGTWAPLQVVTFSGTAPKQDLVQITGIHLNLRARVSTVLAGGTVSVWQVCN